MENRSLTKSTQNKNTLAEIDIDKFFESDEIWKPLTDGLGFKEGMEEKVEEIVNPVHNAPTKSFKTDIPKETKFDRGDLAPFYTSTETTEVHLDDEVKAPNLQETIIEADPAAKIFAWAIDISFISALVMTTFAIVHFTSGSAMTASLIDAVKYYLFELIVPAFCMFYLFYFTILDRSAQSTIGKNLMGLTVKAKKKLSVLVTFRRSLISLCSIPLGFLPVILGYHDKFTDTKVVKTHGKY